jgi:coenzyme F420 hydrogenase subunit beta
MQAAGSRYAPAAPCQAFNQIKQAGGPCVFIGKPCDCAALRKACQMDAGLAANVGLIISIFCAGTPTTAGTLTILQAMGIDNSARVTSFRYRGHGWPGCATAEVESQQQTDSLAEFPKYSMGYDEAWGNILTKHGQLRCRLCPDKTGEFADISLGDPWYKKVQNDPGRSLIIIRSLVGEKTWAVLQNHGYLETESLEWNRLPHSQKSIYQGRCSLWGRIFVMRILMIPFPVFYSFNLRENWQDLTFRHKVKTLLGTFRRIIQRNWISPERYD